MANTKITSRVLADNAVLTANITDANVTTAKVADNAVTGDKVADDVALAGNPTTTTQSAGNNTTRLATTAFVSTAVANLADSAPDALNTLNELAAAMGDDANFSTTITNSIAAKLPLAGGTMTGNIVMGDDTSIGIADDAERIEFDGAGDINILGANLGIGTTSPSTVLEVTGTGDAETGITATHSRSGVGYTLLLNNTNNGANKGSGIKWQSGGFDTGAIITRSDATAASGDAPAYMTFHTSADGSEGLDERIRIQANGKVGIGTDSPDGILHLKSGAPIFTIESNTNNSSRTWDFATERVEGGDLSIRVGTSLGATPSVTSMYFKSNGNVGIGETVPLAKLHIKRGDSGLTSLNAAGDHIFLENTGSNGTGITLASGNTSNGSIIFGDQDSNYRGVLIYDHSADAMKFVTAGSERMLIDSNGAATFNNTISCKNTFNITDGSTSAFLQTGSGLIQFGGSTDADLIFYVNNSARMRLTSEGRLCLGFTAKQEDAFLSIISNGSEGLFNGTAGTNRYRRYFHTASTGIHSFEGSANTATLTNAGAWQDASDVAYKEDIQDLSYGLDAVKALRPRKYKMKGTDLGDGKGLHQSIGFIAQEIESIVPEVVDGEDGEKTLGYGQLTAVLTKAIQELTTKLETAEARIKTLEDA